MSFLFCRVVSATGGARLVVYTVYCLSQTDDVGLLIFPEFLFVSLVTMRE